MLTTRVTGSGSPLLGIQIGKLQVSGNFHEFLSSTSFTGQMTQCSKLWSLNQMEAP